MLIVGGTRAESKTREPCVTTLLHHYPASVVWDSDPALSLLDADLPSSSAEDDADDPPPPPSSPPRHSIRRHAHCSSPMDTHSPALAAPEAPPAAECWYSASRDARSPLASLLPRVQPVCPLDLSDAALLDKYGDGGQADDEDTSMASDVEMAMPSNEPSSSSASPIAKKKRDRGTSSKSKGGNKTTARNQREKGRAASI